MSETNQSASSDDAPAGAPAPAPAPAPASLPEHTGALLPTGGHLAGEPENTEASPAGPGKPLDGSPAVNTYTPRARQEAEQAAGAQDWQALVATHNREIELPE